MEIKKIKLDDNGCLYPNKLKDWYFPNWFNKEHFELFLDLPLSDEQFEKLKEELENSNLMDEVSNLVREFLLDYKKLFIKDKMED